MMKTWENIGWNLREDGEKEMIIFWWRMLPSYISKYHRDIAFSISGLMLK